MNLNYPLRVKKVIPSNRKYKCPSPGNGYKFNMKSTSPWVIEKNIDPNRRPRVILSAKCLCKGCIDPATRQENLSLASVQVKAPVQVYFRKKRRWIRETVMNSTGCTCVMPK
ncbi:interleukin-17B-like [Styela clava]|uniref:interleukin-17B-like n=1 Tax=Styela clava TaxID=7725 RepID=UPI00193A9115|nr:interleukin-17B-like [Styela clava]